jgi:hypothetical protein
MSNQRYLRSDGYATLGILPKKHSTVQGPIGNKKVKFRINRLREDLEFDLFLKKMTCCLTD